MAEKSSELGQLTKEKTAKAKEEDEQIRKEKKGWIIHHLRRCIENVPNEVYLEVVNGEKEEELHFVMPEGEGPGTRLGKIILEILQDVLSEENANGADLIYKFEGVREDDFIIVNIKGR